jgi:hypothetical protein
MAAADADAKATAGYPDKKVVVEETPEDDETKLLTGDDDEVDETEEVEEVEDGGVEEQIARVEALVARLEAAKGGKPQDDKGAPAKVEANESPDDKVFKSVYENAVKEMGKDGADAVIKPLIDHMKARLGDVDSLKKESEQSKEEQEAKTVANIHKWMDQTPEAFGKSAKDAMSAKQFRSAREGVYRTAKALAAAYDEAGEKYTVEQVLAEAARAKGIKIGKPSEEQVTERRRQNSRMTPPSGSRSSAAKPSNKSDEDKEIELVDGLLKKLRSRVGR